MMGAASCLTAIVIFRVWLSHAQPCRASEPVTGSGGRDGGGVYPRYRAGQGPLPAPSTEVEGPATRSGGAPGCYSSSHPRFVVRQTVRHEPAR